MAKEDFCFTYYDGDAARDKAHMTRLERGAYDDLISAQRKRGHLSVEDIKRVLSKDFEACWPSLEWILKKDEAGKYFIEWVDKSLEKMRRHSEKQKENVSKRWNKDNTAVIPPYTNGNDLEMPLEDENGNEDEKEIVSKGGTGEFLWTTQVEKFNNDFRWKEKFCRKEGIGPPGLETKMKEFISGLELQEDFKELHELKKHFYHWFRKNRNGKNSKSTESTGRTIEFD